MNEYDNDVEPTTTLRDGSVVLSCILDFVIELQLAGHTVAIQDGNVVITPDVNEDLAWVLKSSRVDVQAILETGVARVH